MHAAHRSRFAALFLFLIFFSACDAIHFWDAHQPVVETSTAESEVLDVRKEATVIQGSIKQMERQDLPVFDLDNAQLDVSLYFDAGRLRLVDERIRIDNGSYSRNRYYYKDDGLFFFYAKSDIRMNPGEDPAEYAKGLTRMYFNNKGNMFDYEKTVNGFPTELQEGELAAIMRRAFALRELDWDESSGAVDTTAFLAVINTVDELEGGMLTGADTTDETASPGTDMDEDAITAETDAAAAPTDHAEKTPTAARMEAQQKTEPANRAPSRKESDAGKPAAQTHSSTEQKSPRTVQPSRTPSPSSKTGQAAMPPPAAVPADEVRIEPHRHAMLPGKLVSHRIRFQQGHTGATLSASARKGSHMEYVLRGRRGQRMSVTLQTDSPDVFFRVFLNDGDISGRRRIWSGNLPRAADYHIVVYVRPDAKRGTEAGYTISMSIK